MNNNFTLKVKRSVYCAVKAFRQRISVLIAGILSVFSKRGTQYTSGPAGRSSFTSTFGSSFSSRGNVNQPTMNADNIGQVQSAMSVKESTGTPVINGQPVMGNILDIYPEDLRPGTYFVQVSDICGQVLMSKRILISENKNKKRA